MLKALALWFLTLENSTFRLAEKKSEVLPLKQIIFFRLIKQLSEAQFLSSLGFGGAPFGTGS